MEVDYSRRIPRPGEAMSRPDQDLSTVHQAFVLPAEPRGCRKITTRSRFSCRGYLVARLPAHPGVPQRIGYESNLERSFVLLALARPDVVDIIEQPFTLKYTDDLSRPRRYTFDYLLVLRNGCRIAVEVKTAQRAHAKRVIDHLSEVGRHLPRSMADKVRLFTDADFEPWMAVNAAQLQQCRRYPDPDADRVIAKLASELSGQISIRDLAKRAGFGQRAFKAAVRAIYADVLRDTSTGFHGPDTMVVAGASK